MHTKTFWQLNKEYCTCCTCTQRHSGSDTKNIVLTAHAREGILAASQITEHLLNTHTHQQFGHFQPPTIARSKECNTQLPHLMMSSARLCIVACCILWYVVVSHCYVLLCTVLQYTVLHCVMLCCIVLDVYIVHWKLEAWFQYQLLSITYYVLKEVFEPYKYHMDGCNELYMLSVLLASCLAWQKL